MNKLIATISILIFSNQIFAQLEKCPEYFYVPLSPGQDVINNFTLPTFLLGLVHGEEEKNIKFVKEKVINELTNNLLYLGSMLKYKSCFDNVEKYEYGWKLVTIFRNLHSRFPIEEWKENKKIKNLFDKATEYESKNN